MNLIWWLKLAAVSHGAASHNNRTRSCCHCILLLTQWTVMADLHESCVCSVESCHHTGMWAAISPVPQIDQPVRNLKRCRWECCRTHSASRLHFSNNLLLFLSVWKLHTQLFFLKESKLHQIYFTSAFFFLSCTVYPAFNFPSLLSQHWF